MAPCVQDVRDTGAPEVICFNRYQKIWGCVRVQTEQRVTGSQENRVTVYWSIQRLIWSQGYQWVLWLLVTANVSWHQASHGLIFRLVDQWWCSSCSYRGTSRTQFYSTLNSLSDSVHLSIPSRYFFRSGNIEHPGDKLFNTSVEVLPFDVSLEIQSSYWTSYQSQIFFYQQ